MKTPCLYASDISKAIGEGFRGGQEEVDEVVERVLRRFLGEAHEPKRELVATERISDVAERHKLHIPDEGAETLAQVRDASRKAEAEMEKVVSEKQSQKDAAEQAETKSKEDLARARESLQASRLREAKSDNPERLQEAREATRVMEAKVVEREQDASRVALEAVACKRKLEQAKFDSETWARDVRSKMQCSYGVAKEDSVVRQAEKELGVSITDSQAGVGRTLFQGTDHPLRIFGRVDGLTDHAVVEVKCRQRRFFGGHARWERGQANAYMTLFDRQEIIMVESLEGQINCVREKFDQAYWDGVVCRLEDFARTVWAVKSDSPESPSQAEGFA
jgi:hypothetical protein